MKVKLVFSLIFASLACAQWWKTAKRIRIRKEYDSLNGISCKRDTECQVEGTLKGCICDIDHGKCLHIENFNLETMKCPGCYDDDDCATFCAGSGTNQPGICEECYLSSLNIGTNACYELEGIFEKLVESTSQNSRINIPFTASFVNPIYALCFDVLLIAVFANFVLHKAANRTQARLLQQGRAQTVGFSKRASSNKRTYLIVVLCIFALEFIALLSETGLEPHIEFKYETVTGIDSSYFSKDVSKESIKYHYDPIVTSDCYSTEVNADLSISQFISPKVLFSEDRNKSSLKSSLCGGRRQEVRYYNNSIRSNNSFTSSPELCDSFVQIIKNDTEFLVDCTPENVLLISGKRKKYIINEIIGMNGIFKYSVLNLTGEHQFKYLTIREAALITVLRNTSLFDWTVPSMKILLANTRLLGLTGKRNTEETWTVLPNYGTTEKHFTDYARLQRVKTSIVNTTNINLYIFIPAISFYIFVMALCFCIIYKGKPEFESRFHDPDWVASFYAAYYEKSGTWQIPRTQQTISITKNSQGLEIIDFKTIRD